MRTSATILCVALLAASAALGADVEKGAAPAGPAAPGAGRVVVLDTSGFWRMHHTLKPPVIQTDEGLKPLLFDAPWLDTPTAPPPQDWTAAEFDDSAWPRAVTLRAAKTPYLARLCLRGRFEVSDPSKVNGLMLTVAHYGGAAAYLNGKEIGRKCVSPGAVGADTLAEGYPPEASLAETGELIGLRTSRTKGVEERKALRERTLEVAIPPERLRKGVNALCVEIVRAPYHKLFAEKTMPDRGGTPKYCLPWNTCEVRRIQLSADHADGLVPNAVRPRALQVWNGDLMMSDFDMDFGDPNEALRPVRIVAARSGMFSGKVIVGSSEGIRGLKATAGDLRGPDGVIPASAVRVRYALPWGNEWLTIPYTDQLPVYPRAASLLGVLAESAPAEFPVPVKESTRSRYGELVTPNQPEPVLGAVVPVWVTVSVPADAKPGTYRGEVRLEAEGLKTVSAPVEVKVVDWALPDTQDFRTWVELIESPDTLAVEYKEALWSERNWRMIEQAMRYIGQTGCRVVHIPLIAENNLGAEQSMVRWIKKSESQYDHDLTVMDRYLDAAVKNMGRPRMVVFWVWDIYMTEKEKYSGRDHLYLEQALAAREAMRGTGPRVTLLDPATGKTENGALPPYKDPAAKAQWQPLMEKIQERLKARGLETTMVLGMLNDVWPSKEDVQFFADIVPGTPWVSQSHGGPPYNRKLYDITPVAYQARVWTVRLSDRQSLHGWNNPNPLAYYDRDRELNPKTPAFWNHMAEMCITGEPRGIGRLGADCWPVYKGRRGDRGGYVWARYIQSSWRNLDLYSYCLAPSPDGPAATPQFELLREGIQYCEARIAIEKALLDKASREKLGEDLAASCEAALDERHQAMVRGMAHLQMSDTVDRVITSWHYSAEVAGHIWFAGSHWQERGKELYALAGEVQRKLEAR